MPTPYLLLFELSYSKIGSGFKETKSPQEAYIMKKLYSQEFYLISHCAHCKPNWKYFPILIEIDRTIFKLFLVTFIRHIILIVHWELSILKMYLWVSKTL